MTPLINANSTDPVGYIIIHLVTQGIKLGWMTLWLKRIFLLIMIHNEIEWAIIYMRTELRETVLEHEVGHALRVFTL